MGKTGQKYIFKDRTKLEELVSLRRAGYSYPQIALYFGVAHPSVVYQCKKAGLAMMNDEQREDLSMLIKSGASVAQAAEKYNLSEEVVVANCARQGLKFKIFSGGKKLVLQLPHRKNRRREHKECRKVIVQTRPGWIFNGDEWVCAGKSMKQLIKDKAVRDANEREKKKLLMLQY